MISLFINIPSVQIRIDASCRIQLVSHKLCLGILKKENSKSSQEKSLEIVFEPLTSLLDGVMLMTNEKQIKESKSNKISQRLRFYFLHNLNQICMINGSLDIADVHSYLDTRYITCN